MTETAAHSSHPAFDPPRTTLGKYCPSCHSIYLPPEAEANFCAKDGAQLLTDLRVFGGKYVLGEPLGHGHMSEVYVATQAGMGRRVALKLLRSEHASSPEMRKRFEREAQIASSLDHPNAVTIFDSGHTSDGQSYIAMEFLSGETLDRVIQREAPMPLSRALDLIIPMVRALAAAHSRSIIHRDVKPDNIFVARKPLSVGAEEVVKMLDFGIARVVGRKTRVTSTQTALGTPHYMAPETLQGEEATTQSDVYAIGVILTELLTGKLPWGESSRSDVSTVMARLVSPPLCLTELLPGANFPADLQPALDQFLSPSIEDRPVDGAVALHILLQLAGNSAGTPLLVLPSSSVPALPDSSSASTTLPAPPSSPTIRSAATPRSSPAPTPRFTPIASTASQDRATRPIRNATAVMNNPSADSSRSRRLTIALVMLVSLIGLWTLKSRLRSPAKPAELATAIAPLPPPQLFVPEHAASEEPAPTGARDQPAAEAEPTTAASEPNRRAPSRTRSHHKGSRETPSTPQPSAFPLDTKGY